MTVIVIVPHHDVPTCVSSLVADDLLRWAKEQGFQVKEVLYSFSAIRPVLYKSLLTPANLVCYYGHGSEVSLPGQIPPSNMVDKGNVEWLRGKIVTTFACLSAFSLGKEAVQDFGIKTYFGSDDFMFVAFPEQEHNYLADLSEWINIIPKTLMQGYSAKEAYERYLEHGKSLIDFYENKLTEWPNADWYIQAFRRNLERYRLIGDPNATLENTPPTIVKIPLFDWRDVLTSLAIVTPLAVAAGTFAYHYAKEKGYI